MVVLTPALILGALALVLGALLAIASVVFKTQTDERIEKIAELLPGANCGGCSYAGCMQFAKAIVEEGEKVSLCNSAGNEAAAEIAQIMGREAEIIIPKKAVVLCSKTEEGTKLKYNYYGVPDCFAAQRVIGGPNACKYGCIGFGSCVSVCPEDAISIKNSLAVVNEKKCIGCGACKNHCPQNIIELVPKDISVYVKCKNADKGSETRKVCDSGCIGCGICAKICESGAIDVSGVAKIDYEKCTSCGNCVEKCPKKVVKKC